MGQYIIEHAVHYRAVYYRAERGVICIIINYRAVHYRAASAGRYGIEQGRAVHYIGHGIYRAEQPRQGRAGWAMNVGLDSR